MEMCATVEQAMAREQPFGDDAHILDVRREYLLGQLEQLSPELASAAGLLDAIGCAPGDHHRLLGETTLRSAIDHAHKQLTSRVPRGPRLLPVADCAAVFTAAAHYVRSGGTDTPLQDGSLVPLGPDGCQPWIWRDEHAADSYGHAFRELLSSRYRMLPTTPAAATVELLWSGARLLEELLPSLAPSALHHARVVACVPASRASFGSSSRPDLGGMLVLNDNLGSPWWVAEHLLHESTHLKLYDLLGGDTLAPSEGRYVERPVVVPWNPSMLAGANRWHAWRVLAAFHVYVHMALLAVVAERRAPQLEADYGPLSGMLESRRALARARFLGRSLRDQASCWNTLGPVAQGLADWLCSQLDTLQPDPAPDGATLHLALDLYQRETGRIERMLAETTPCPQTVRDELSTLAGRDVAITRAVLLGLDDRHQLTILDDAVAGVADTGLADGYPQIRSAVETCLLAASSDGYRLGASGDHDAAIGEMVDHASDALFALLTRVPAPVARAKRRAVCDGAVRLCDDGVGRLLALQAAHLPSGARILEIGTGVGLGTAWLVTGLGARTDVGIVSVQVDGAPSGAARSERWPAYVRIDTADAATTLASHPGVFDLIVADASIASTPEAALTPDHVGAAVGAARPGGMLILFCSAVRGGDSDHGHLEALRHSVIHHPELLGVEVDSSGKVVIATRMR